MKETTNGQAREASLRGQSLQSNCQSCVSSPGRCTVAVVILDAGGVSIRDCLSRLLLPLPSANT